jgi:hypothetical protein
MVVQLRRRAGESLENNTLNIALYGGAKASVGMLDAAILIVAKARAIQAVSAPRPWGGFGVALGWLSASRGTAKSERWTEDFLMNY